MKEEGEEAEEEKAWEILAKTEKKMEEKKKKKKKKTEKKKTEKKKKKTKKKKTKTKKAVYVIQWSNKRAKRRPTDLSGSLGPT